MNLLVLAVFCIDGMGIKMTFRCAGHAVLNKKCNVPKPLTWLRPSRESSLGTAITDRLASSLLDVSFWLWHDTVCSGVSASVTVDLLYSTKAMQTNLNFVSSLACHVLSKALLFVECQLSEILWLTATEYGLFF